MSENTDLILFPPEQISQQSIEIVEERSKSRDRGVYTGFTPMDNDMIPMFPGDLITVLGRPSNYKTGFMLYVAGKQAQEIMRLGLEDEVVVYITWEIAIEEAGIMDLCSRAGVDMSSIARGTITEESKNLLMTAAVDRMAVPMWMIGHSLLYRKKRPGLTLTDVGQALMRIEEEYNKKIRLIFLDYLQNIMPEQSDSDERRLQIARATNRCKDMALALGCPVILGCQARREVDQREYKLPGMADGMDSSAIEHTSDKIISLWMPFVSHDNKIPGENYVVQENTLVIGLTKQRWGKSQRRYIAEVDFRNNEINPAFGNYEQRRAIEYD